MREILAGMPLRVIAALADTSVVMIERTYSKYIAHHVDSLAAPLCWTWATPFRPLA